MKRKPAALRNIGIDIDREAIEQFRCPYPVELIHGCAHEFLSDFGFEADDLVYADPPYLRATRRSKRRYRHEYSPEDHTELLGILRSLPCQVMVSGHPSALYDDLLGDWRRLAMQVVTQAVVRTEVVWFNFEPDRLHWADCAGRNFTDRQRIKRLAAAWAQRYAARPPGERLAILSAMMATEVE